MDKLVIDGKVAIVISCGYGSGITHPDYPQLNFDPNLAIMVIEGRQADALAYIKKTYPDVEISFRAKLGVEFLPVGTKFRINEYDGYEYIITENDLTLTA